MTKRKKKSIDRKPKRIIDGYEIKQQAGGLYKVVEYSHIEDKNNPNYKKRTRYKDLNYSEAEDTVYRLERS